MPPRSETVERLLSSLEWLERQSSGLISAGAWPELSQLLDREEAVVAGIVTALRDPSLPPARRASLRERLHHLLHLQVETQASLTEALRQTSEELREVRRSESALRTMRPRYGATSDRAAPRFTAVG